MPDTYAEQTPTPVVENAQDQPSTELLQDTNASEIPSLNAQDETLPADPMLSQEVSDGFLNEESTPFVGVENQQQNPESSEMVSPENNTDFLLEEAPSDQEVPLMMSEEPLQEETAPSRRSWKYVFHRVTGCCSGRSRKLFPVRFARRRKHFSY